MIPRDSRILPIVLLSMAAAVAAAPPLGAAGGRDFAGRYHTTQEVESGEVVFLTFEVEVFNYSGAQVLDATVRLENPLDPTTPYASWPAVSVAARDRIRLSAEVTVPRRERDGWQKGAAPHLTVSFRDGQGLDRRAPVELMRHPLPAGGQQP